MATNGWECGGLRIEGVENGFIVHSGSEKFVFVSIKATLKFIEEAFKE
jgi:hypothetical protein